eukprot:UN02727
MFPLVENGKFLHKYKYIKKIGKGCHGNVFKIKSRTIQTVHQQKACKVIFKSRTEMTQLKLQIDIIENNAKHKNVINLIEGFEEEHRIF